MIEVQELQKQFGNVNALDGISFSVSESALCGFIGANGAGKTTTMRILATLEHPTSGQAFINGYDVIRKPNEVRREIGYMPDYYGTYPDMIVAEYLDFFARAYRLVGHKRQHRILEIGDFTDLTPLLQRPVEGLSKGQKQRLSLARALLSDPSVLILDEPAAGLDPRARRELRELLKMLAQQGKVIFISSHILSELADLVEQIVIIDNGKIRYAGSVDAVDTLSNSEVQGTPYALELATSDTDARKFLLERPSVLAVTGEYSLLHLRLNEEVEAVEETIASMIGAGIRLRQFYRRRDHLEDVFMAVTSEDRN
ncbi:MAG: ABC transporter ATP-binding protein [Candidatus Parabeggiatoa sp. nov. 1]|nr:MAG: ABC transporter ATP-binding protein [Gammaproteobacteria bacterium]